MAVKSLGIFEVKGMAALVAAADVMLKAAEVELRGRQVIGAGWVSTEISGELAAVETAIAAGKAATAGRTEVICAQVVPRPVGAAMAVLPHRAGGGAPLADRRALGLLETQDLATLIAGADAMAKSAAVELGGWAFIGGALVHLVVRGDVASVETAVAAGFEAATAVGTVHDHLVLAQPSTDLGALLPPEPTDPAAAVGALGILETIGYVGAVAGADAMTKAAEVEILRLSLASGGRLSVLVAGGLDDVEAALSAGKGAAAAVSQVQGAQLVSRPDPAVMANFGGRIPADRPLKGQAMGLIETRSTVALVKAVDQMLKSADVEYEGRFKVGYYLTAATVRGDVGAVQVALAKGADEAAKYGELVATHLIPHPLAALEERLVH